eukprot:5742812-Prymnesium_polylepis.1
MWRSCRGPGSAALTRSTRSVAAAPRAAGARASSGRGHITAPRRCSRRTSPMARAGCPRGSRTTTTSRPRLTPSAAPRRMQSCSPPRVRHSRRAWRRCQHPARPTGRMHRPSCSR